MFSKPAICFSAIVIFALSNHSATAQSVIKIDHAARAGVYVCRITAPELASKVGGRAAVLRLRAVDGSEQRAAFVPDSTDTGTAAGSVICTLKKPGEQAFKVVGIQHSNPSLAGREEGAIHLAGAKFAMDFTADSAHGSPCEFDFATGLKLTDFAWNDRVYKPDRGGFMLRNDKKQRAELLLRSDICSVIRTAAYYCAPDGKHAPGDPMARYTWVLFPDSKSVYVYGEVTQKVPAEWTELHFLEFNISGAEFTHVAGGEPENSFALKANKASTYFSGRGVLSDGQNSFGMYRSPVTLYDGRGEYGTYLHGVWMPWNSDSQRFSAWLYLDTSGLKTDPQQAAKRVARYLAEPDNNEPIPGTALLSEEQVERKIRSQLTHAGNWLNTMHALTARKYLAMGNVNAARLALISPTQGASIQFAHSGTAGIAIEHGPDGCRLLVFADLFRGIDLLAAPSQLFYTHVQLDRQGASRDISGDHGWGQVFVLPPGHKPGSQEVILQLSQPTDLHLKGLSATVTATPVENGWEWGLRLDCKGTQLSVMRADYPILALAEPGANARMLLPVGSGQVRKQFWSTPSQYSGTYPSGWCAMQLAAAYDEGATPEQSHGLYLAIHDPLGSMRDWRVESDPASRSVNFRCQIPAPSMNIAGNGFLHSGTVSTRILHGDWYEAAQIYGKWVRKSAAWWPTGKQAGRQDTPEWMRNLAVWLQMGGPVADTISGALQFQKRLGTKVGLHWYNWHHNPFDNDYPHYLPARPGVAEGVQQLQQHGIHVMPYINGRLWDTRDDGLKDLEFTSLALPNATKDGGGHLIFESYGSKESDGSDVKLGVMCPTTPLWKQTVNTVVNNIFKQLGTDAVYIDQVGAAPPVVCEDKTHAHAPGGGSWWNQGYWDLVDTIRKSMPGGKALTTECNAEPFIRQFDGYLTWHWQYDGQVPVFPAIYSSAVRTFGRSYAGGLNRDLAFKMRAAQQLMFGEQIGWFSPDVAEAKGNFEFLQQVVFLRSKYNVNLIHGQMARPPHPLQAVPMVTADWQWAGVDMVTTSALFTSEWRAANGPTRVMLFANVSDKPIRTQIRVSEPQTRQGRQRLLKVVTGKGTEHTLVLPLAGVVTLDLGAHDVAAWEIDGK